MLCTSNVHACLTCVDDFAFTSLLEANRKQDSSLGRRQISRAFSQTSQATVAGQALLRFQVSLSNLIGDTNLPV